MGLHAIRRIRLPSLGLHEMFLIGIAIKGLDALLEGIGGLALLLVSHETILDVVQALTQEELSQDPHDWLSTHLLRMARHLSMGTQEFMAVYLIGHGVIKAVLVAGLARDRRWAFPLALAALAGFVVYQLWRYAHTLAPGLLAISVLDVAIVALVAAEWRAVIRRR